MKHQATLWSPNGGYIWKREFNAHPDGMKRLQAQAPELGGIAINDLVDPTPFVALLPIDSFALVIEQIEEPNLPEE